jgi:hypothetical protein
MEIEIEPTIPLENVKYQRTATQIDDRKGVKQYPKLTLYVRAIDRQRVFYDEDVKSKNRILVIGIWQWGLHNENNLPQEFAIADKDQLQIFQLVFENIVKNVERKRFVSKIYHYIDNYGKQCKL